MRLESCEEYLKLEQVFNPINIDALLLECHQDYYKLRLMIDSDGQYNRVTPFKMLVYQLSQIAKICLKLMNRSLNETQE